MVNFDDTQRILGKLFSNIYFFNTSRGKSIHLSISRNLRNLCRNHVILSILLSISRNLRDLCGDHRILRRLVRLQGISLRLNSCLVRVLMTHLIFEIKLLLF